MDKTDNSDKCSGLNPSERGFSSLCEGCPNKELCQSQNQPDPSIQLIKEKLLKIKNIILILSGKGGVGKSSISSQLALSLAQNQELEIGLLDTDICGPSIQRMMNLEKEEVRQSSEGWIPVYKEDNLAVMSVGFLMSDNQKAIIWRGPRKNGLIKQFLTEVAWNELDYLIIDTPPGTSDEHLSLITYLKETNLKGAIIVTTPQEVSLLDVRKEINFCIKTSIPIIGVIENMSGFICPHCNKKSELFISNTGGARQMCKEFNLTLLAQIPFDPFLLKATEEGKCILIEAANSPVAFVFKDLIKIIISSI